MLQVRRIIQSIKESRCNAECFRSLHIERWAFDVELIKIAEMSFIPVSEVAVNWKEVDGSKLDPATASIQMFKDILLLWLRYRLGLWCLVEESKKEQ